MAKNNLEISYSPALKLSASVSLIFICCLLLLSVIFFKERMLFLDGAHVLFRIINDDYCQILDWRYGYYITQVFPLWGARLHLPLRVLMILFSSVYSVFHLTVAALLFFRYKNYGLAVLLGFYLCLFVSEAFFFTTAEGIGLLFFALGINFHVAARKWPLIPSILLFWATFYLAIWTHPLVMLPAVYLWFFFWAGGSSWPFSRLQSFIYTGLLLGLSFVKYYHGTRHGYDSSKLDAITQLKLSNIPGLVNSPQLLFFFRSCLTNYWLFALLFLGGLFTLAREKKYFLFAWTLFYTLGYCLLVFLTYRDESSNRFYIESEYMPLAIISSAPFVYYVLAKLTVKKALLAMVFIFSVRIGYMLVAAPIFSNRVDLIEKTERKMKENHLTKVIFPGPVRAADSVLLMSWATPIESSLFSGLSGDKLIETFIFANPDDMKNYLNTGKDTFLGCWEKRPANHINVFYFHFDTSTPYKIVNYDSLMR
jgi:hypothetical protein